MPCLLNSSRNSSASARVWFHPYWFQIDFPPVFGPGDLHPFLAKQKDLQVQGVKMGGSAENPPFVDDKITSPWSDEPCFQAVAHLTGVSRHAA